MRHLLSIANKHKIKSKIQFSLILCKIYRDVYIIAYKCCCCNLLHWFFRIICSVNFLFGRWRRPERCWGWRAKHSGWCHEHDCSDFPTCGERYTCLSVFWIETRFLGTFQTKIFKIFYLIVCWQVGNTLIYILGNVLSEFKNRLQRPNSVDSKVHQKKGWW